MHTRVLPWQAIVRIVLADRLETIDRLTDVNEERYLRWLRRKLIRGENKHTFEVLADVERVLRRDACNSCKRVFKTMLHALDSCSWVSGDVVGVVIEEIGRMVR